MSERSRRIIVLSFAVVVLLIGALGMGYKMAEFIHTIVTDEVSGFGVVAVGIYLAGVAPILFLTLWGVAAGHFRDIERPKYRMLELDKQIEQRGNVIPET